MIFWNNFLAHFFYKFTNLNWNVKQIQLYYPGCVNTGYVYTTKTSTYWVNQGNMSLPISLKECSHLQCHASKIKFSLLNKSIPLVWNALAVLLATWPCPSRQAQQMPRWVTVLSFHPDLTSCPVPIVLSYRASLPKAARRAKVLKWLTDKEKLHHTKTQSNRKRSHFFTTWCNVHLILTCCVFVAVLFLSDGVFSRSGRLNKLHSTYCSFATWKSSIDKGSCQDREIKLGHRLIWIHWSFFHIYYKWWLW